MTYPPLKEIDRNRMLAQRELLWASEQKAAAGVVGLLDKDVNYRMLTHVLANYLWATILLWGFDRDSHKNVIEKALESEASLSIWGNSTASLETINTWLTRGRKWTISELSQLIRLFVVVLEFVDENINDESLAEFNRIDPKDLKMMLLQSSNYVFKGDHLHRFNSDYQQVDMAALIPDEERGESTISRWKALVRKVKKVTTYSPPENPGLKLFKKRGKGGPLGIDPSGPRSRLSTYTIRDRILGLNNSDVNSKRRIARLLSYSSSGTSLHSIQPDSLIGGLEWIYGLPGGADTSGTTAEVYGVCWALEDYLPKAELDSMAETVPWFLGPALAIVQNTHHTFFEFAIAVYAGEILKNDRKIGFIPGKYQSLLDQFMPPSFNVDTVNDVSSDLLARVYKQLYDAKVTQDRYIFKPNADAWSKTDINQISLRGGTISNSYSYNAVTQAQIDKVPISKLVTIGARVLGADIVETSNTAAINKQLETIYSQILTSMR